MRHTTYKILQALSISVLSIPLLTIFCLAASTSDSPFKLSGIGGAGGIHCVTISPHDPNFMLFASDMGGAYRSVDGGKSWQLIHLSNGLSRMQFSPQPAYLASGRVYWVSGFRGICVSDDKGKTWKKFPKGPWEQPHPELAKDKKNNNIQYITVIPDGKETLLVSTVKGLWKGQAGHWEQISDEDGGPVLVDGNLLIAALGKGQVMISHDNGVTWSQCSPLPGPISALDSASDVAGNSLTVAAVVGHGLFRSEDLGQTWTKCKDDYQSEHMVIIPSGQTKLAFAAQTGSNIHKQILRSKDGGKTWEKIFRMPPGGKPKTSQYNVDVSFIQRKLYWGYYICKKSFSVSDTNPNTIIVGTQGELFMSRDCGDSWQIAHAELLPPLPDGMDKYRSIGLEVTAAYGYYVDPHDPQRHYICLADIGFARSLDGGDSWSWAAVGAPWRNTFYDLALDPDTPGLLYAASSNRHEIFNFLGTSATFPKWKQHHGGVIVSRDYGATWKVPYNTKSGNGLPVQVCSSIILDPKSPPDKRTLFACIYGENDAAGVYVSHDSGQTWQQTPGQPGVLPNRHVGRVRLHPITGDLYCLVTGFRAKSPNDYNPAGGGLWRSSDQGKTWEHLTKGSLLNRWATDFSFDSKDKNTIFVSAATPAGGMGVGGIYRTKDGGKSWLKLIGEKETQRMVKLSSYELFMAVSVHPDNPDIVFAGSTFSGLFVSTDGGKTWRWCHDYPFVTPQRISFDPNNSDVMYIASMGAGIWTASVKEVLRRMDNPSVKRREVPPEIRTRL